MRKFILSLFAVFLVLYVILHLVLGSSPVQKRVVAELQQVLTEYGINLTMESIEFSALSPKIYLNRVKIEATPKSKLSLAEPLSVDKIKIQFRPLALIFGRIVFDEVILFHPRIQVPQADKLYKTVMGLFGSRGAIKVERGRYDVIFHRLGVVDAFFNIESSDPQLAVRSRSLTVIVEKGSGQQRSVVVQSGDLELVWKKTALSLTKVDVDVDLAADSLRLNKGVVETNEVALNLVGVSRMPGENEVLPRTFNVSYEVKAKLGFLKTLPTLGAPDLTGTVQTAGTIKKDGELFSGKGQLNYESVYLREYEIGTGGFSFALDKRRVDFTQVSAHYGGGHFTAPKLQLELNGNYPITGDFSYTGLLLEKVLRGVGVDRPQTAMRSDGKMKVAGTFSPFEIKATLDPKMHDLVVLDDPDKAPGPGNTTIDFGAGTLKGLLVFTQDKMDFDGLATILSGDVTAKGYIGFDDDQTRVQVTAQNASLTQMARIANLSLAGVAKLNAEVVMDGDDTHVSGDFEVQGAKVAGLDLGIVSGEAFYQGLLLTFENLILPSLEPVRGNGYVDFKGDNTQYKFYVNARRTETDQIFAVLKSLNLTFEVPKGGEVNARIAVEGGGERGDNVHVSASGQAKNFQWFEERWVSGAFNLTYADSVLDLGKALLTKPSGALEVKGRFAKNNARLQLSTFGLDVSQFERLGQAPITGEIAGQVVFEGARDRLFHNGKGELKLVKTKFRGVAVPDSVVKLRPDGNKLEYTFSLGNDKMRGRFVRSPDAKNDDLLVSFQDYDFAPFLTLVLGHDVPSLADLRATGDLSAAGNFDEIGSLKGSGTVNQLLVGFKGTPMKIHQPVRLKMDQNGIRVDQVFLHGEDSQLALALNFESDKKLEARADGRIDLQYLQPFIPGLDYGTGKVSVGLRMSGHPSRYQLLGNVALEGGSFRLSGFVDEFRAVEARLSVSQDRINIDRFESNVNGGVVTLDGDVRLERFKMLAPNIRVHADKVVMRVQDYLTGKLSGEFTIRGKTRPYTIGGRCDLHEGTLTRFQSSATSLPSKSKPIFNFDIQCQGSEKLFVATDLMQAEFRGNFHLVGDNQDLGLLGLAESQRGSVLFRDTKFNLDSATVKFESPNSILPRFRVSSRANVREVKDSTVQSSTGGSAIKDVETYEINLQVFGTPADYKIRLTSNPALLEGQIISLLVLGVATGGQKEGAMLDLGSALVGQIPIQNKLKNELGLNIKISNQPQANMQQGSNLSPGTANTDINAPTVQVQKQVTDSTRLSYSNSLESAPVREFRIEQMLDENISVNAATMERSKGGVQNATQAYGLDFRYRFSFE